MSPFPFAEPVRAIILFGDFHSADNKQSHPQIDRPKLTGGMISFFVGVLMMYYTNQI